MGRARYRATPERGDRPWQEVFIETLGESPNVAAACRAAGVARSTAYRFRDESTEFAARWDDCQQSALDDLEGVAFKRAKDPKDQGSTTLLVFLLKSHRRDTYGDKLKQDINVLTGDMLAEAMRSARAGG